MSVFQNVDRLVAYGRFCGLIGADDEIYVRNRLLWLLGCADYEETAGAPFVWTEENLADGLEETLGALCDDAAEAGLIPENTVTQRDLFDTKLMNCLMPRPSEFLRGFEEARARSAREATDYFYKLSQDSDYIRRYRIRKDLRWKTETPYGALDITINLSKPEKDPKDIAAAKKMKQSGYPKCLLCMENVGYAGRANHPARDNHRIVPLKLDGADWGFQYSPYVYYNEHCIVFNQTHTPMRISDGTFRRLFDFVEQFPHYFLGSNADLPIVGGSILTHDHFQGGNYTFAMARAEAERSYRAPEEVIAGDGSFAAEIVHWPMSVLRLRAERKEVICREAARVLAAWRGYTDEAACIFAETDGEAHNTITPIARMRDGLYELDLVLRNNLTTAEHPMGLYHPHEQLHHIKKENIGLIEVMGLAVLPARLKSEMAALKDIVQEQLRAAHAACDARGCVLGGGYTKADAEALAAGTAARLRADETLAKHADWTEQWLFRRLQAVDGFSEDQLDEAVQEEIGKVFCAVLEDAGVYKCTEEGRAHFERFLHTLGYTAI